MEKKMENKPTETNEVPVDAPVEEENGYLFDYEEINISSIRALKEAKILPTFTHKELDAFAENLDKDKFSKLSSDKKATTAFILEAEDYINPDDIGAKEITPDVTNSPTHNDISLKPKDLKINKRVKSQKAALMKLTQKIGIGIDTHIPLWHSGFWVTIAPMLDEDIINLELEIISELTRIGKETTTLVYSNYSVIFAEVILKHFKSKLLDSTLKLDGDDILDYININDVYTIALFMAKSMYPHGFQAILPCNNTVVLDSGVPKCSYKAKMQIDLNELLVVDTSLLSDDHVSQMAKKTPGALTVDDVTNYQETLLTSGDTEKTFEVNNEVTKLILGPVSASKYIESGNVFISELRDKAVELIKSNNELKNTDDAERIVLNGIYLNVYSHYVKGIPVDDAVISDPALVRKALTTLTSKHELASTIIDAIKKYIDDSQIATIGIPNFACPVCSKTQTTKELIPLAVYEYFFTLLHSRYEKIMEKM